MAAVQTLGWGVLGVPADRITLTQKCTLKDTADTRSLVMRFSRPSGGTTLWEETQDALTLMSGWTIFSKAQDT